MTADTLTALDAHALSDAIHRRDVSCREVMATYLARIARLNPLHTAIVALTHDPKVDDLAMLEGLRSQAFYLGALGSKRTTANRAARLVEHFGMGDDEAGWAAGQWVRSISPRTLNLLLRNSPSRPYVRTF